MNAQVPRQPQPEDDGVGVPRKASEPALAIRSQFENAPAKRIAILLGQVHTLCTLLTSSACTVARTWPDRRAAQVKSY